MSDLPLSWAMAALRVLGSWTGGGTPTKSITRFWNGAIPWVSPKDMKVGRIKDTEDHITTEAIDESAASLVPHGSVLIVTRSGILRHSLPIAVADVDIALNQDLKALTVADGVHPDFVAWALRRFDRIILSTCAKSGTTVQNIETTRLLDFEIPLAPSAEQRRIVAAIAEQFSRLDSSDELLLSARRRLRALRSHVLNQVVDAPWPRVRIGDVADVGSGATPKRGSDAYWLGGTIPWVTSGQLTKPFVRQPAAFITETALRETNVKLWPKHTLLVALYGEGTTRGHCSELLIEATTNQACAAVVLRDDGVDRSYLKLFFGASYDANRRLASGGVQPNLSLGLIKSLRFPLPPLDEQQRIVANVEQQLSIIDAMASRMEAAASRSAALRRSILEQAFSGKLVPQDPSDEPASVLLERIAAERSAAVRRKKIPA